MDIVCGVHGKCQVVIQSFLVFGQIFDSVCVFSGKQKKTVLSRKCSAISYNSPHQKFYLSRNLYSLLWTQSCQSQKRSYHSDRNTEVSAHVSRAISNNEQSALIDCYYPLVCSHPPS